MLGSVVDFGAVPPAVTFARPDFRINLKATGSWNAMADLASWLKQFLMQAAAF